MKLGRTLLGIFIGALLITAGMLALILALAAMYYIDIKLGISVQEAARQLESTRYVLSMAHIDADLLLSLVGLVTANRHVLVAGGAVSMLAGVIMVRKC